MAANDEQQTASGSTFLQRLTSYPLVKYSYETTLHFYNEAKEKNSLVKKGLELAETSVGTVATSPLVQNSCKSWEPLLTKADQFGCSQLDKAEVKLFQPAVQLYTTANATLTSSKKIVEEKVANSKKLVEEKVVRPISSTYHQLVSLPTVLSNKVFDFAEDSVEYYLPEPSEGDKEAAHVAEEEAQETVKAQTVWARSSTLSRRAYRRAQRKAAHRVRIARLYGESVLTKYPLAVTAVNYARTRDPEIRATLVQQVKTTVTYYTDKTKGFLVEKPLVKQATSLVQPYFANLSYQSFYSVLLTLLATVAATVRPAKHTQQPATSTSTSSSSSSSSSATTAEPESDDETNNETTTSNDNENDHRDEVDETAGAGVSLQEVEEDNETSGPAEPDHSDTSEEEKDDKEFDDAPDHETAKHEQPVDGDDEALADETY